MMAGKNISYRYSHLLFVCLVSGLIASSSSYSKNIVEKELDNGERVRVTFLKQDVFRVHLISGGEFKDTGLNRYGFIIEPSENLPSVKVIETQNYFTAETKRVRIKFIYKLRAMSVTDRLTGKVVLNQVGINFTKDEAVARFKALPNEDWVGFGDQTRKRLYHRGYTADCHVRNVKSYIPVPFFMSTGGVGVLVNTTHRVFFDMCKSDKTHFSWRDYRGDVDYYVFLGADFKEILDKYTDLTGKPKLPPEWSFGLWYIARMYANDYEVVSDAMNFRREEIPCDVIGIEPMWMEKYYDHSVDKAWNKKLFPFPDYNWEGPHNFFNALDRMGFRLELWLCNQYDLSYEAERRFKRSSGDTQKEGTAGYFKTEAEANKESTEEEKVPNLYFQKGSEVDERLVNKVWEEDKYTKPEEAWFEHLKKFVDQGFDFFKQDGNRQVSEFPGRIYGNGMLDDEMHNLNTLLYSKQMYEGFEEYTNRRPVVFTDCGWTGFQAWAGTWTGDTGGKLDTLGAILNTALVGHSWATTDMEVVEKEGIHYGYLQPWSQINSWNYFRMPWIQGEELLEIHKYYSRLRARLIPYIYSWAYQSTKTAVPLLCPLTLEFQNDLKCRNILHQYLLGRDLLVINYKTEAYFPKGRWKDYWSGEVVEGGQEMSIEWPIDKGGGLFIRSGGIVPHGPVMQYRGQKPLEEIDVYVFPEGRESVMEFYEDDGITLEHMKGKFTITPISTKSSESRAVVRVGTTKGLFKGKVQNRRWSFTVAIDFIPVSVKANDKILPQSKWEFDKKRREVKVHTLSGPVEVIIE